MFSGIKSGAEIKVLYEGDSLSYVSASEADLALCNALAFQTNRDAARMDRLFRASGRMRLKWDEVHDGMRTYGRMTIEKAIEGTPFYASDGSRTHPVGKDDTKELASFTCAPV